MKELGIKNKTFMKGLIIGFITGVVAAILYVIQ